QLDDAATHATSAGCTILLTDAAGATIYNHGSGSTIEFYSSSFISLQKNTVLMQGGAVAPDVFVVYNCLFDGIYWGSVTGLDAYNVYITKATFGMQDVKAPSTTDRLTVSDCGYGMMVWGPNSLYVTNAVVQRAVTTSFLFNTNVADSYLVDGECDVWNITWAGVCTAEFFRQYTFNMQVVDADGAGILGVTVAMVDNAAGAVFSVATDANGDIAEQIVTYGYYDPANGNVIQPGGVGYTPFTVTLSKAGYITRTIVYAVD
ncbi:unnamed protein product, partial [marine sediment metagenome]